MKIALAAVLAAALSGCTAGRFEFALIGDQQYDASPTPSFPA